MQDAANEGIEAVGEDSVAGHRLVRGSPLLGADQIRVDEDPDLQVRRRRGRALCC